MVKVQIFNIMSVGDAESVTHAGADFVGTQISSGNIPYTVNTQLGARICKAIKSSAKAVVIPISRDPNEILELTRVVEPDVVQLANDERMLNRATFSKLLRSLRSNGFTTTKVIAMGSGGELELAKFYAGKSDLIMLDTFGDPPSSLLRGFIGGTGKTNDWTLGRKIVESIDKPVILAGGLSVDNLTSAIERVKPWGVDAASSLSVPGEHDKKDIRKVRRFVELAKGFN